MLAFYRVSRRRDAGLGPCGVEPTQQACGEGGRMSCDATPPAAPMPTHPGPDPIGRRAAPRRASLLALLRQIPEDAVRSHRAQLLYPEPDSIPLAARTGS